MAIGLVTPLERAIAICRTQTELARRVTGKPATGHVYHWLKNGVTESVAIAIEQAVDQLIAESPEAAARAVEVGGAVRVEEFFPDHVWERDASGNVITFTVRVAGQRSEPSVARRTKAAAAGSAGAETDGVPVQAMSEAA